MQRGRLSACASRKQLLSHFSMPVVTSIDERRGTLCASRLHSCAVVQQEAHHAAVAAQAGEMQRGGLLLISRVDCGLVACIAAASCEKKSCEWCVACERREMQRRRALRINCILVGSVIKEKQGTQSVAVSCSSMKWRGSRGCALVDGCTSR